MSGSNPLFRLPQSNKTIDHFTEASSFSCKKPDDQLTYLDSAEGKGSK